MTQHVKDQAFALQWIRLLPWPGFDPWPGKLRTLCARSKKKAR